MFPIFNSKVFFAPMSGVTDPALRLLAKEAGAGLVVTEFINSHAIEARSLDLLPFSEKERPLAVQLFGNDIDSMLKAAQLVEPHFDIIDINMGCPSQKVTAQQAGAALLQDPKHVKKLLTTLVKHIKKPISIKMRLGVNEETKDAFKTIALIAQDAGVKMITLHPRTVKQGYSGKADWSKIKELKELVSIPVVGNGDIRTPKDAKDMFDQTGCDYVMVGRAAAQNPYLFTQINDYLKKGTYNLLTKKERVDQFLRYLDYSKKYSINFVNKRFHALQFTKGIKGSKRFRELISSAKTEKEIKVQLNLLLDEC